jgi:hypothetical protein
LRFFDQFRLGRFFELMNSRQVVPGYSHRGEADGEKPRQDRSSDQE